MGYSKGFLKEEFWKIVVFGSLLTSTKLSRKLLSYWRNPEVQTQGMRTTQSNRGSEMQIIQAHHLPCGSFEPQKPQQH